jgi:PilZ domain
MEERRKYQRKYLIFFGRVFDRESGQLLGQMADITPGGAMIISGRPIEIGKVYHLHLDLPEDTFKEGHIDFEARSIWCQADIDPSLFNTGFELLDVTPKKAKIVEQIIQEYTIRDSKAREG